LDLAYSMIIYCLESLAQKFDKYQPIWADFDLGVRGKLDKALATVPEVGKEVRSALVESAHLKLTERFLHFVEQHMADEFFTTRARKESRPLRRSEPRQALKNACSLRSSYVHRLQPIREQLHLWQIGQSEVFEWEGEPY